MIEPLRAGGGGGGRLPLLAQLLAIGDQAGRGRQGLALLLLATVLALLAVITGPALAVVENGSERADDRLRSVTG